MLFVDDGDVLTAAGVAAGIDLCLHLIRRDHGSDVANRVARLCVVPPWREGGQAQFIERPVPGPSATATTAATRAVGARAAPSADLPRRTGRSRPHERPHVSRRFRDEVGMTPGQWLTRQRVEHARRLLETTELPVDRRRRRGGLRHRRLSAPAPGGHDRRLAHGLPPHVPRRRPHAGEHTVLIDFLNARCRLPATRAPRCPGAVSLDRHEICPIRERFLGFGGIDLTGRQARIIVVVARNPRNGCRR